MAQLVKNLPAIWEAWVHSLGWEDPLEKGKATHSSILAWRSPRSPWGRKESDMTERLSLSFSCLCKFFEASVYVSCVSVSLVPGTLLTRGGNLPMANDE